MKRSLASLTLLLAVSGCGLFKAQEKKFFSLETIDGTPVRASGLPVGVDVVELPPSIDRREIVVRGENGSLDLRGRELWSAPLEAMTIHTLAFDLAQRTPEGFVILPGQPKPVNAMRSLHVIIEEMAAGPEPVFVLDTRWLLRIPNADDRVYHERIDVPLASLESAEIASATSQALATLADRIAARLGE